MTRVGITVQKKTNRELLKQPNSFVKTRSKSHNRLYHEQEIIISVLIRKKIAKLMKICHSSMLETKKSSKISEKFWSEFYSLKEFSSTTKG